MSFKNIRGKKRKRKKQNKKKLCVQKGRRKELRMIYVYFNRFRKTKGKEEISHERSLTPGVNESLAIKTSRR